MIMTRALNVGAACYIIPYSGSRKRQTPNDCKMQTFFKQNSQYFHFLG